MKVVFFGLVRKTKRNYNTITKAVPINRYDDEVIYYFDERTNGQYETCIRYHIQKYLTNNYVSLTKSGIVIKSDKTNGVSEDFKISIIPSVTSNKNETTLINPDYCIASSFSLSINNSKSLLTDDKICILDYGYDRTIIIEYRFEENKQLIMKEIFSQIISLA